MPGSFGPQCCDPKVLGEGPNMEISQKWLGEGAKGVLDPGSKGLLALVQPHFAPVQNRVWVVQKTLGRPLQHCSLGPKHLLHPLLTTFGKFPFSGPLPEPWGRNLSDPTEVSPPVATHPSHEDCRAVFSVVSQTIAATRHFFP